MNKKIKKAIFPVGGLGTRFLPATKSMPKEMLPVASKPIIQYAFEEARSAGIEQFIFITGRNKNAISNHFDHVYELEDILTDQQKEYELNVVKEWLPEAGSIAFVRQQHALGLGHAVWCARNFIEEDESFVVILADEMIKTPGGFIKHMINVYENTGMNLIAVSEIEKNKTKSYGIIDPLGAAQNIGNDKYVQIKNMVEKPNPEDAPSNYAIIGRYILNSKIFKYIESAKPSVNNEIQLTDAMRGMLAEQKFGAVIYEGERFDCGNRIGFLEANIAYMLEDEANKEAIKKMLEGYIK